MKEKIEKTLEQVRLRLAVDGGSVELVDVEDGVVKLNCWGLAMDAPWQPLP